jgi:hypothetical protein
MKDRRELLQEWSLPHVQRHGVTLVARADAEACLRRVFSEGCDFFGYDAFTVFEDGGIQPHSDFSPSWSGGKCPPLEEVLATLTGHPGGVTHYEFVFRRGA